MKIAKMQDGERTMTSKRFSVLCFLPFLLIFAFAGCRTAAPFPPVDFKDTGWKTQHGQAVWTPQAGISEIAGDLLLANHADGRTMVQFSKTPFTFVIAQTTTQSWKFEIPFQTRTITAPGKPPARIGWLHLARCLQGGAPPKNWEFHREKDGWVLENIISGEVIEGFIDP